MADLHESHEEQVERTVSSPEAVTEYLNGYVRPYRIWYERTAKRNYRYLSLTGVSQSQQASLRPFLRLARIQLRKLFRHSERSLLVIWPLFSRPLRRWHPGCCSIISRKRLVSGKRAA